MTWRIMMMMNQIGVMPIRMQTTRQPWHRYQQSPRPSLRISRDDVLSAMTCRERLAPFAIYRYSLQGFAWDVWFLADAIELGSVTAFYSCYDVERQFCRLALVQKKSCPSLGVRRLRSFSSKRRLPSVRLSDHSFQIGP